MKLISETFPFIEQTGAMDSGTASLAIILKFYGYYDIYELLSKRAGESNEVIDLYTLSELAEDFGFETDGLKLNYSQLSEIQLPCIGHFEGNHLVVLYKVTDEKTWISDPTNKSTH